jgi:uncharacterized protein YifE (UPF0438 family)
MHTDFVFLDEIRTRFSPVYVSGPCVPLPHPMASIFVDYIFDVFVAYSRKGNFLLNPPTAPTTLESYGQAMHDLARRVRFPTPREAHDFADSFDSERACFKFADNKFVGYVDKAHEFLKTMDETHQVSTFVMLSKQLRPSGLCSVRIGSSALHGQGVFAARHIRRGELITTHPCHYITISLGQTSAWFPADVSRRGATEMLTKILYQYSAKVDGTPFSIACDPNDPVHPAACAQMINDGASLERRDFSYDDLCDYVAESTRKQNCHFVTLAGFAVVAVASRDIERNEEVFASYGFSWWSNFLSQ